jgi:phenylacetate-CoA ligase
MNRDAIYRRLPRPLQHVAVSAAGIGIELRRYDRRFDALLREFDERAGWDEDRLREFRDTRLRAFLTRARAVSPYWAERLAATDFGELPVIDKRSVVADAGAIRARPAERDEVPQRTSGTTGQGLQFFSTRAALREQWAVFWRYLGWHGISRGTSGGWFFEKELVPRGLSEPPFWRYNAPGRQVMFSTQHMSEANLPAYVEELRRRRLTWLHGYPSAIALLADHIARTGADLGYAVTHVTLASENVLEHQRAAISRAFGVQPRQHYAMTEAVTNASECERGALHVDEDFALCELLPDSDSGTLRIVGTNLSNPAFPLIRYATSDVASEAGPCSCGRPGRTLRVDGREEDYVVLRDGTRLGRLDHVFKDAVAVREAQIVQSKVGEVTVNVVRGDGYSDAGQNGFLDDLRRRVGADTVVKVRYCERIPREASGKLRFVISDVGRLDRSSPRA